MPLLIYFSEFDFVNSRRIKGLCGMDYTEHLTSESLFNSQLLHSALPVPSNTTSSISLGDHHAQTQLRQTSAWLPPNHPQHPFPLPSCSPEPSLLETQLWPI